MYLSLTRGPTCHWHKVASSTSIAARTQGGDGELEFGSMAGEAMAMRKEVELAWRQGRVEAAAARGEGSSAKGKGQGQREAAIAGVELEQQVLIAVQLGGEAHEGLPNRGRALESRGRRRSGRGRATAS